MRIRKLMEDIAKEIEEKRKRENREMFFKTLGDINQQFLNGFNVGAAQAAIKLTKMSEDMHGLMVVMNASEFMQNVEAEAEKERERKYRHRIEMERQLGLKFVRDTSDRVRVELGLQRVHHI